MLGRSEIAALAVALGAFDAEHVELAFDVAEDEIGAGHCSPSADSIGSSFLCADR